MIPQDIWKHSREESNKKTRLMGFTPAEETGSYILPDGSNESLQWQWRKTNCRRDPSEILWAIIDGLTQEGVAAWPGDGTGIVEQIVRVQYERAEKAEAEVKRLKEFTI